MPKRLNPFEEEGHQFKTHVRQKDVDLGVNQEENMKAVYDKTLKLLYHGASTLPKTNGVISSNGSQEQATNQTAIVQNGHAPTNNGKANGRILNICCISNPRHKCSFCERCICIACRRVCSKCNEVFCFVCSILQYNERDEVALCLLCLDNARI